MSPLQQLNLKVSPAVLDHWRAQAAAQGVSVRDWLVSVAGPAAGPPVGPAASDGLADRVAQLEAAARFPHVTAALSDLRGITLSYDGERRNAQSNGINSDVVALAQRFGMLMAEYNQAIGDGKISVNEAKRLLRETLAIQQVLLEMKLNLEDEAGA